MLIRDWMAKDVITIQPDNSMMRAAKTMKDNGVDRLPVVDASGALVGLITDRDVKEASPSKATTLDVHELYYLLSEIKVQDIMTTAVTVLHPFETVERAAVLLMEKGFDGAPVVDDDNKVVGMLTNADIFKVLIAITGVRHGGIQIGFDLPNTEGALQAVQEDIARLGARVISILTNLDMPDDAMRHVYIRCMPMEREKENAIVEELKAKHKLIFWARDNVHPII